MFKLPVVKAKRFIRGMRGQTRAQLISANDGHCYVVKFSNNPLGVPILVNELVSTLLLKILCIRTPEVALVSFDEEALANNPEIGIETATGIIAPQVGLHFGSRHPGPMELAVYDFLPDKMFPRISNQDHFLGALVFDKWVSNFGFRQAIFYRPQAERNFIAEMIGHAWAFRGPNWTFFDAASKGLYPRLGVYGSRPRLDDFDPWLDKVMGLDAKIFQSLFDAVPQAWIAGQEEQFSNILMILQSRTERLPELLEESLAYIQEGRRNPVPVEQPVKQLDTSEECVQA